MRANDTPELAEFRAGARRWLQDHRDEAPTAGREGAGADTVASADAVAARRAWQNRLARAGLLGVTWPREYGGRGLSETHQLVIEQELEAAGVPGAFDIVGIHMVAPAIMAHGSPQQRRRHLPPLLRGDEVWCQLFSEPAAGSDLAGITTLATPHADGGWTVSGQKSWTTNAQHASFGLMLARTDPEVPKHRGLTMFVVPMTAGGVTVRPLRQLSGAARFNEVFLDRVSLGADSVIGPVGGGWTVALDALSGERLAIGLRAESLSHTAEDYATALSADAAAVTDAGVRRRLGEIACELLAHRLTAERAVAALQRGDAPGESSALTKITAVDAARRAAELICDVLGPGALDDRRGWGRVVSDVPGLRTAGGTEEIVRTMVGERALGLPPEPRVDKDVPFSALPRSG